MEKKILCCVCLIVMICLWPKMGYNQIFDDFDTIPCLGFKESFDSWYIDPFYQEDDVLFKPKDTSKQKAKVPNGWIVDSRYTIITGYSLFFIDTLRDADFGLYSPGALGTDSALYLRPTDYEEYRDYNNALTTLFSCSERYDGLSGYYKYEGDQIGDTLLIRVLLCYDSPLFPVEGCILGQKMITDYPQTYQTFFVPFTYHDLFSLDTGYYFTLSIAAYSNDMVQDTVSFFVLDELTFVENTVTNVDTEELELVMHPNPFRDHLYVKGINAFDANSITFYNLWGVTVRHYEHPFKNDLFIDTSSIPPGLYIILARDRHGRSVWKRVVKP